MSDEMEYYKDELNRMSNSIKKCDMIEMLDLTNFFMAESNAHMTGISEDVQDRIKYYIRKFKQDCQCKSR